MRLYTSDQCFPTFFGLQHPYLILKTFGGTGYTPWWLNWYKDRGNVTIGGTPDNSCELLKLKVTSEQRPRVNNSLHFRVPRVVDVYSLDWWDAKVMLKMMKNFSFRFLFPKIPLRRSKDSLSLNWKKNLDFFWQTGKKDHSFSSFCLKMESIAI